MTTPRQPKPSPATSVAQQSARAALGPTLPSDAIKVLGEIGANASSVHIYRVRADGSESYCGSATARVFSMEYVRTAYGPGDYVVKVFAEDEEVGIKDISIEPRPEDIVARQRPVEPDISPALREILNEIRNTRRPGSDADPMELAAKLGAVSAQNTSNMVTMLTTLLENMKQPVAPAADPEKFMEVFIRGMEMGKDLGGASAEGYGPVLTQLGKPLLELLTRQQQIESAGVNPAKEGQEAQPMETMKPALDNNPFSLMAPFMTHLLNLAHKNADVDMWGGVIEAQHPDAVTILIGMVNRAGLDRTLRTFFETYPTAQGYHDWFTQLFTLLVTEPDEQSEPDESSESTE